MIIERLQLDPAELAARTGWELKPEGACKGDRCVPIPGGASDGLVDARVVAERLGMALVADERHGLWALGPEAGGRALQSAQLDVSRAEDERRPLVAAAWAAIVAEVPHVRGSVLVGRPAADAPLRVGRVLELGRGMARVVQPEHATRPRIPSRQISNLGVVSVDDEGGLLR